MDSYRTIPTLSPRDGDKKRGRFINTGVFSCDTMPEEKQFDKRFNFFIDNEDLKFVKREGDKLGVSKAEMMRRYIHAERKKKQN